MSQILHSKTDLAPIDRTRAGTAGDRNEMLSASRADASALFNPVPSIQPSSARAQGVALFALTLLLSSTLLFLVQPMFAKMVLPRLGGTAAVWNTCMVFFQACLLGGYAYAHVVTRRLCMRNQLILHAIVLALPLLILPVALPQHWAPPADANPIPWLLLLLTVSVGLPFFVVSTTAPLVQTWFALSRHRHAADPYFLYAASNAGSMLALLAYPTVVEPLLRLGDQTRFWTAGYLAFVTLTLLCGIRTAMQSRATPIEQTKQDELARDLTNSALAPEDPVGWIRRLRWIALALVPSSYLLGVTTYITTDVAAVPLLWVLPLALYLLTFILVFARKPILTHRAMVFALPTIVLTPVLFLLARAALPVWAGVSLHLLAFFVTTMVCHGELARLRPSTRHLTEFYLMMSLGGVLGGAFNALVAPLLFTRALEYPLAIGLACLLCPSRALFREKTPTTAPLDAGGERTSLTDILFTIAAPMLAWITLSLTAAYNGGITARLWGLAIPLLVCVRLAGRRVPFALAVCGLLFVASVFPGDRAHLLELRRSFFGVHRIVRSDAAPFNELFHGTTLHGRQFIDANGHPQQPEEPLTYYHRTGPVGAIFAGLAAADRRNVGVIGLGVGSIAAYAGAGDHYTFYEIDPIVRWAADGSGRFGFLRAARERGANVNVVLGDARLTLADTPPHALDLLVLDAFSGDAIPLHLLTREALATYLQKLSDHGVLAVHISNLYLNLEPVLANLANDAGCACLCNNDLDLTEAQSLAGKSPSKWILIARDRRQLAPWTANRAWTDAPPHPELRVWTDDYSNILTTLR